MVAINICNYLNLNKLKLNKIPSSVALAALQVFNSCMRKHLHLASIQRKHLHLCRNSHWKKIRYFSNLGKSSDLLGTPDTI